jgi:nicotinamidase-related amidase
VPVDLSELLAPPHTAVVTMELQRGVIGDLATIRLMADEVEANGTLAAAGRLVQAARRAGVRVVHCTFEFRPDRAGSANNAPMLTAMSRIPGHLEEGSPAAQLVPELGPEPTDLIESRRHGMSPFGGTSLDATLRSLGVRTVVAVGVSINIGIFGLVLEAVNHGYRAAVPIDAVAGTPADYAEAVLANSIAPLATLTTVDGVLAAWSRAA